MNFGKYYGRNADDYLTRNPLILFADVSFHHHQSSDHTTGSG
jgi:hypothetical protein